MGQVEMHLQGRTSAGGDRLSYIVIVEKKAGQGVLFFCVIKLEDFYPQNLKGMKMVKKGV